MINFNKQFFKKHQKALLFCANKWYLKWLLGLNRLPKDLKNKKIEKIDVASIHWKFGKKMKAACFTRPRFAEALAFNLSPFCYFKSYQTNKFQWRFSPAGLAFGLLFGYFGGIGFMGTTTDYYAGAGDGNIRLLSSGNPTQTLWDTTHDATTGSNAYPISSNGFSGIWNFGSSNLIIIQRAFFPCDTSGIGAGAIDVSGILKMYVDGRADNYNGDGYDYVAVVQTDQPDETTLTTADYNNCGATDNPTKGSADIDIGTGLINGQYNNLTLNASGNGWISLTDFTLLGLREGHDIEDNWTDPLTSDKTSNVNMSFSEQANQGPYLEVTYSVPAAGGNMFLMFN